MQALRLSASLFLIKVVLGFSYAKNLLINCVVCRLWVGWVGQVRWNKYQDKFLAKHVQTCNRIVQVLPFRTSSQSTQSLLLLLSPDSKHPGPRQTTSELFLSDQSILDFTTNRLRTTGKNGCNASCFRLYGFHLNRAFSQHQNTASFGSLSIARHFLHKSGGIELSTIWNRRKDRNTYLWKLIYSEFHIWWESMICHTTQGCQIRVDICVIR